jgi:hypothetical protein
MSLKKKEKEESHLKSVLMAYFILVLHVVLITALVLLVIFFRGIINYMIWIFIVGTAAIVASAYHFYKRMRMQGKTLQEMLNSPRFAGRTVEINFLGGLASLKISGSNNQAALDSAASKQVKQLEDPNVIHNREFSELVRLLENNLITFDEYNKFKERILKS